MARNFSRLTRYNGKDTLVTILRDVHPDGPYFEVNIQGFPRFYMQWSQLGRYDLAKDNEAEIPYDLVLAVSDIIEEQEKNRR